MLPTTSMTSIPMNEAPRIIMPPVTITTAAIIVGAGAILFVMVIMPMTMTP